MGKLSTGLKIHEMMLLSIVYLTNHSNICEYWIIKPNPKGYSNQNVSNM